MIKRVVLLVNYNLYESKRHFTEKLSEALKRHKIETHIIDFHEHAIEANTAAEIQRINPDFTCSFNSFDPLPDKKYLWDFIQIPHISFLVDPALYYVKLTNSPYSILSCVDQSDVTSMRSYNFQNVFFWPHAVEKDIEEGHGERPYDVVFLGSCYDPDSLKSYWEERNSPEVINVLNTAAEKVLSDRLISLTDALVTSWNEARLPTENVDFMSHFSYLDNYTRGKDRVDLIRAIKDAKVHVFGDLMTGHPAFQRGWSYYLGKQKNVTVHPAVPFGESLRILQQSKICLNSIPCFRHGSHERIFTGLGSGALPITSDSTFWRERFKIGEDFLIYQSGNWGWVNDQVNDLLSDAKKRKAMVSSGRAKVMRDHTWDKRVEQLLKEVTPILEKMKASHEKG